jgi:hypothetical protein
MLARAGRLWLLVIVRSGFSVKLLTEELLLVNPVDSLALSIRSCV